MLTITYDATQIDDILKARCRRFLTELWQQVNEVPPDQIDFHIRYLLPGVKAGVRVHLHTQVDKERRIERWEAMKWIVDGKIHEEVQPGSLVTVTPERFHYRLGIPKPRYDLSMTPDALSITDYVYQADSETAISMFTEFWDGNGIVTVITSVRDRLMATPNIRLPWDGEEPTSIIQQNLDLLFQPPSA